MRMREKYASADHKRQQPQRYTLRKSSSDLKTAINFCRTQKSMKFLKGQLISYRKNSHSNQEIKKQTQNRTQSKDTQRKERKFYEQTPANSKQLTSNGSKQLLDKQTMQKYQGLVDNLLLNLAIFKKVFNTSKKKRSLIEKLYGWDHSFKEVFFNEQELKPNLKKQQIMSELGLDKKGFAGKNVYNKLRFFVAELIALNFRQQQIQCAAQKQKLSDSCSKVVQSIQRLSLQSKQDLTKDYIAKMKNTHYDMLNMKMRIKNRGDQLQKIAQKTGTIKLDPFFFKEEKNINRIQAFLKEQIQR